MILRLIQFKRPSHGMLLGVICFTVFLSLVGSGRAALQGLAITPGVWGLGLLFGRDERLSRTSRFEAALPIRGRDIYCAKMIEEVLGSGLALLAVTAAILASRRAPVIVALAVSSEVGALLVLGRIAEHAYRPAEVKTPKWWGRAVGGFVLLGSTAIGEQIPRTSRGSWVYVPMAETICILALCAVGSIALFWRTWSSIPDALQLYPADPTIERHREKKPWLPSFRWQPLLPALFGVGSLIASLVLLGCGVFGLELPAAQIVAIVTCWFAIWGKLSMLRVRDKWVFALPLSRQRIFLAVTALPLGVLMAGSAIHFSDAPQSARALLCGLVAITTAALLPGIFVGVPSFAHRHRVPWAYIRLAAILAMIGGVIWPIGVALQLLSFPNESWPTMILPRHFALLCAAAVPMVGAAYWLGVSGFQRMETLPPRMLVSR